MSSQECQDWLSKLCAARPIQFQESSGAVSCSVKPSTDGVLLEVVLNGVILPTQHYLPVLHFLNTATEKDTVVFYIDNNGGSLFAGVTIAEAFKRTKAKVITKAITIAASSAALIFTNGHEKTCLPGGHLMYHTASYLTYGKTQQHAQQCAYITGLVKKIMEETLGCNLITEQEERDISRGSDIFIPGKVVRDRLQEHTGSKGRAGGEYGI